MILLRRLTGIRIALNDNVGRYINNYIINIFFSLLIILFINGCSTAIPLFPESSIRPYIETSLNKNWGPNFCERIAVVNLKYRSIPSAEDYLRNYIIDNRDKYGYGENVDSLIEETLSDSYLINKRNQLEEDTRSGIFDGYERNFSLLGFDVVDRSNIEALFEEMALSMMGFIDKNTSLEVGKLLSADCVCLIEVTDVNGKMLFPPDLSMNKYDETFKVTKVETGQIAFQGWFVNAKYGRKLMFNDLKKKLRK